MVKYLTNIDPNYEGRTHDDLAFQVYVAALRSGQNVKYLTCPMPPRHDYEDYGRNVKSGNFNHFGCVVGFEEYGDYSDFWEEYRKLEPCIP
jgi:hypothetical protein